MPDKEKPLPIVVTGLTGDLQSSDFKEKELKVIANLTEGVKGTDDWTNSTLLKVLYTLPVPVALVCAKGYILAGNEHLQDLLGYSETELQNMKFDNFTRQQDRSPDRANFNKLVSGIIDYYKMEKGWITKSGLQLFGKLAVIRIPWPASVVTSIVKQLTNKSDPISNFPVAVAMVFDAEPATIAGVNDGNRKLFWVLPEWAIDKISHMTWTQNLSLVLVVASLLAMATLVLNFVPKLIEIITK